MAAEAERSALMVEFVVNSAGQYVPQPEVTGLASLRNFDDRNEPFFLYNFDIGLQNFGTAGSSGDMVQSGGNPVLFCDVSPGKQGLFLPTGARLTSVARTNLGLNSNITLMQMFQLDAYSSSITATLGFDGTIAGTESNNMLYGIMIAPNGSGPRNYGWRSQHGAGLIDTVLQPATFGMPNIHNLLWLGVVRSGTSVSVWANGQKTNTGTIIAPTGGNAAGCRLWIGGTLQTATNAAIHYGAKGVARAYSDAEMAAEYNYTMGVVYGEVPA